MAYFRTRPSELWPLETRRPRRARRQILSYAPRLVWLEARTLLAGTFVPDLTAEAVPLTLGSLLTETIAPLETTYYRISSDTGGKLMVMLQASGFARVSIVDPQGHPLVQSDGPAPVPATTSSICMSPPGMTSLKCRVLAMVEVTRSPPS